MKQHLVDGSELRRYLLGELGGDELLSVEERLFLDGEYLLRMQEVEDELIDDYVYGELPSADRERFESHFLLQPGRRDDLRVASALKSYIASEAEPLPAVVGPESTDASRRTPTDGTSFPLSLFRRRPALGFLLAAAALVILAAVVWLAFESSRRRDESAPVEAHRPTPQQTESPAEMRRETAGDVQSNESPQSTAGQKEQPPVKDASRQSKGSPEWAQAPLEVGRVRTVQLLPGGVVRGGGSVAKVVLSSNTGSLLLQLYFVESEKHLSYSALVQLNDSVVYGQSSLRPRAEASAKLVTMKVPTVVLSTQTYQVKLNGVTADGRVEEIASYAFQVEQK